MELKVEKNGGVPMAKSLYRFKKKKKPPTPANDERWMCLSHELGVSGKSPRRILNVLTKTRCRCLDPRRVSPLAQCRDVVLLLLPSPL